MSAETIGYIVLGVIGGLILIIPLVKFLSVIFLNFVASRIFSFAGNVASIVLAILIVCSPNKFSWPLAIGATISTVLSWLFFIAPIVFDTVDDFEFGDSIDDFHFSQAVLFGGIVVVAGAIVSVLNLYFGELFPAIFFIIPILICIIDIVFTLRMCD